MLYFFLVVLAIIFIFFLILDLVTSPSNNRNWNNDQAVLPEAKIDGSQITIRNIRNFSYASTTEYTENYYDKTFDLDQIKKVWYVVEPFSGIPGSAHTFLSFEFDGDQCVSISVEIRKEKGESFHPLKGLLNQYELMYVIADERDVIKLRSNYRQDLVYVYPVNTTTEKARELFLSMISRANQLKDQPEFYHSITNTCTTNIVRHINEIAPDRISLFDLRVLLPANSDQLAYELGLLDTDLSFEDARQHFFINDRALKFSDDPNFSLRIRE